MKPKAVSIGLSNKQPVAVTPAQIPTETADDHQSHGSPASALEAKVDSKTGTVVTPRPTPAKAVQQPQSRPATPVQQPQKVEQVRVTPAPQNSGEPVEIKPKQVGEFIHEVPRHEPGYIEDVDQDDLLGPTWYAQQILSALPEIAYDVYPEPQHVTPIQEVKVAPAPVFIEPIY